MQLFNGAIAIIVPEAMKDAILPAIRTEMITAGVYIVADELQDAFRLGGILLDAVIPVGVDYPSEAMDYLFTRLKKGSKDRGIQV